jgi:hypothetical protein
LIDDCSTLSIFAGSTFHTGQYQYMKRLLFAWTLPTPSSLFAQAIGQPTSPVSIGYRLWVQAREYVTQSAADMSEAQYGFRPTPEVRTFGESIGHLAAEQMNYCALVLGEKSAADGDVQRGWKTKAALQERLRARSMQSS